MAWLAGLLQLGDTFYPTGAYAHSFGLEGLVEQGVVRDRESLRAFLLHSALPALRQAELPLVVHAWTALGGAADAVNWTKIGELSLLGSALKSAKEARLAAENIGRQRVELAARLRSHALAAEYLKRAEAEGWPHSPALAAALEARVLGAPLEAAMASVYYASLAGLLAAAMKLLRLGQNAVQRLVAGGLANCNELLDTACSLTDAELGSFNPWWDIASSRHERADFRLFIS